MAEVSWIWFLAAVIAASHAQQCTVPCQVGQSCAMVRLGNGQPRPGCISMREALMMEQALNGGAHGPSSGIRHPPRPHAPDVSRRPQAGTLQRERMMPMNDIMPRSPEMLPGMEMLGIEPHFPPGNGLPNDFPAFPGRFPQPRFPAFVGPPDPVFQPDGFGYDFPPAGNGGFFPVSRFDQNGGVFPVSRFDPNSGRNMGQIPRQGLGMRGNGGVFPGSRFDPNSGRNMGQIPRMRVPSGASGYDFHGPRAGSRGGRLRGDFPGGSALQPPGIGPRPPPPIQHGGQQHNGGAFRGPRLNVLPGEHMGQGPRSRNTITSTDIGPTNTNVNIGQGQGHNDFTAQETHRSPQSLMETSPSQQTVTRGDVTTSLIISDESGVYYMFYPSPDTGQIRVNVTKDKFCNSEAQAAPRDMCLLMCYSDSMCPGDQKCCPSGCSLTCTEPVIPANSTPEQTHVTVPASQTPLDVGVPSDQVPGPVCGQRCEYHHNCPGLWEYCLPRDNCGGKVCVNVV